MDESEDAIRILWTEYDSHDRIVFQLIAGPFGLKWETPSGVHLTAWGRLEQLRKELEPLAEHREVPAPELSMCSSDLLMIHSYSDREHSDDEESLGDEPIG